MEKDAIYILISVYHKGQEQLFSIRFVDKTQAKTEFKALDEFKRTLPPEQQEILNIHLWGEYEISMLISENIMVFPMSNVQNMIKHLSYIFSI
jgi:hypothetical protein